MTKDTHYNKTPGRIIFLAIILAVGVFAFITNSEEPPASQKIIKIIEHDALK